MTRAALQEKGWRGWLRYSPEPSAGRHIYELTTGRGKPLDLDVIDMTWLDANVQARCPTLRSKLEQSTGSQLQRTSSLTWLDVEVQACSCLLCSKLEWGAGEHAPARGRPAVPHCVCDCAGLTQVLHDHRAAPVPDQGPA